MKVLHSDNHVLVVAKPAGVPTVPDASGDPSLLDAARDWVRATFDKPGDAYLGVVHRLDRPVSGVLALARTSKAAARLTAAFREGRVEKVYLAVVAPPPPGESGRVEQWLVKDRARNTTRAVPEGTEGARRAVSDWRVLARASEPGSGPERALVELVPATGRPHQLRVALASLGAPILGDLRYGATEPLPDRSIALHALRLTLPHPTRDETVRAELAPPHRPPWTRLSARLWTGPRTGDAP